MWTVKSCIHLIASMFSLASVSPVLFALQILGHFFNAKRSLDQMLNLEAIYFYLSNLSINK
jgi:hypothetical protein